jgi:hypothetical protein
MDWIYVDVEKEERKKRMREVSEENTNKNSSISTNTTDFINNNLADVFFPSVSLSDYFYSLLKVPVYTPFLPFLHRFEKCF